MWSPDIPPESNGPDQCHKLEELERDCQRNGICISYQHFRGRQHASAGTILQRCRSLVTKFRNGIGKQLCVYKLGMTAKPTLRFKYYQECNYTHMSVLHVSTNLGLIQMLEAALISDNFSEKGCRNQRYGGEGPPGSISEPFHFVYVVGARADSLKPIRWKRFAIIISNATSKGMCRHQLRAKWEKSGEVLPSSFEFHMHACMHGVGIRFVFSKRFSEHVGL